MDANDLRELANALEPMAKAPRFEDFDVPAFCAWVRACADEKPVGYVTANGLRSLRQDDATVLLYAHDYLIRPDHVALYTHPAPAAPQAEPCIGNDSACPCQDGDACHYKDAADGTKAWPVPQAEPKREPSCLWSRADDDTDVWETKCGHAFTIIDGTPTDNQMAFCCYCGRRVDEEIGGGDAE